MVRVIYTEKYLKRVRKFLARHPELEGQYEKVMKLLSINPWHPSLRLHKLKGKLVSLRSVSINRSYRITLQFVIRDDLVIPVDIGTHGGVYGV